FHVHHRWTGWNDSGALHFSTPTGASTFDADAVVLALGGGSWPQLGSDGAWVETLVARDIDVAPLMPANCGFDTGWSDYFARRFAGTPLKPVVAHWRDAEGVEHALQGECVLTTTGIEGSLVYALSARLREAIARDGHTTLGLDLAPGRALERLQRDLGKPRNGRSLSEHLRRQAGIEGAKAALLHEVLDKASLQDMGCVAATLKRLPLHLLRPRPMAEAISTAGGVRLEALDNRMMLQDLPGVFCAGEMLDWEAPTGGYLLTACFASGLRAGRGATGWLAARRGSASDQPATQGAEM
ncbi:MAG: TIGR03862 family flavoprotein, partial [Lysobacteraceae bacterium]